ncbi:MAG TPA: anion permease [Candidatus Mediterraneibacter norfolkensis]|nr:anion permease [Candidatus Mediterraneibacter norfolkensis]
MNFGIIVTFAVVIVMAALFLQGKYSFGLITMACAVVLVMTGVLTIPEAFAGFSNSSVILIAVMITMTAALQKTSFPLKISQLFRIFDGKRNGMLVAGIIIVFLIMNTVLPDMVSIALTITFLQYLPEESGVKPSKMVIPLMAIVASCVYAAPLGVGATQDFLVNTYVSGVVVDPNYLMQFGDLFKLRIPTIIVTCIYIFFMWKKMPDSATGTLSDEIRVSGIGESTLKKWQEYLVYVLFVVVILVMIFNTHLGELMYMIPAAAVCVLGFTKILSPKELITNIASDTSWLYVGILAVTAALTGSGAADLIGELLLPLISWTNNGFIVILLCCTFTAILTTFLSNTGTQAVMTSIAASVALAAGMDPRSLMAACMISGFYAFCFPSGSVTCAFAFSLGNYNPVKFLKYTLPLLAIMIIVTSVTIYIAFPPFP